MLPVAFAVPIYEYRDTVRRNRLALSIGVCVGMTVALVSSLLLARAFHFDHQVARSLMARSISTPFAMALAGKTGGSPELVALFIMITGLVGMIAGDVILSVLRLRSPLAHGASFGAAAYGFGTPRSRAQYRRTSNRKLDDGPLRSADGRRWGFVAVRIKRRAGSV